jgi:hypothetical protein
VREREDGNGERKREEMRYRGDSRWATFESLVLAREGKRGGRGRGGLAVSGEQG